MVAERAINRALGSLAKAIAQIGRADLLDAEDRSSSSTLKAVVTTFGGFSARSLAALIRGKYRGTIFRKRTLFPTDRNVMLNTERVSIRPMLPSTLIILTLRSAYRILMSVILEFTADADDFVLGHVLSGPTGMHYELEKIIPTEGAVMPFIWVTDSDFEIFEENVRASPYVKKLRPVDKLGDTALYRIEWTEDHMSLLKGFTETDATVLEAKGNDDWVFRIRFPDHDKLSQFANYLTDHKIPINIVHTYTLTEETERGHHFDLTHEQREALVLALKRGYFATPKEVRLDELAHKLGITKQAASSRIRLGAEKVLRSTLMPSADDAE